MMKELDEAWLKRGFVYFSMELPSNHHQSPNSSDRTKAKDQISGHHKCFGEI
jgi:hypothetical protein